MESLSWSQAVSPRLPHSSLAAGAPLSVLGTLDFAALLGSADRSLNLPASNTSSHFSGSDSDYQSSETQPPVPNSQEPQGSLRQEDRSGGAESDHATEETDESDQSENGSEATTYMLQSHLPPDDTEQSEAAGNQDALTGTELDNSVDAEGPNGSNSRGEFNQTDLGDFNREQKNLLSEKFDSDAGTEQPEISESTVQDLANSEPSSVDSQLKEQLKTSVQDTTDSNSLLGSQGEKSAFGVAIEGDQATATHLPGPDVLAKNGNLQPSLQEPNLKEPTRDIRGVGNRRGKAIRWFERSDTEQLKGGSQASAAVNSEQMLYEGTTIQVGLAANGTSLAMTKQSADSQSTLPAQSEQLGSSAFAMLPTQMSQENLAPLAPPLSTIQSATAASSGMQASSEVGTSSGQLSSSADLATTRNSESSSATERVHPGLKSGENESQNARDAALPAAISSDPSSNLVRAERLRMIQRVARSFHRLGTTGGTVQLRLHPPELGSLSMQVQMQGRNMTAQLTTESATAREIIMDSLPQLRERLAVQGYEVTQITVDVADQGASGNNGEPNANTNSNHGSDRPSQGPLGAATDLRRSAYLRRQMDSQQVAVSPFPTQTLFGIRGIDLHA